MVRSGTGHSTPHENDFPQLNRELLEWATGRRCDRTTGRLGDRATGRLGDWAKGRLGERATGRKGDWVSTRACVNAVGEKRKIYCASTCQEFLLDTFQTHIVSCLVGQII